MNFVVINGKRLEVRIADSVEEREEGLQGVQKLEGYDGMLFVFEKKEKVSFWNKNTLIDLDLVWIAGGKVVGVDFLPNQQSGLKIIQSPREVDMVLELPSGKAGEFKISEGDMISWNI